MRLKLHNFEGNLLTLSKIAEIAGLSVSALKSRMQKKRLSAEAASALELIRPGLVGRTFGYLTVEQKNDATRGAIKYTCYCECGQTIILSDAVLRRGRNSCGLVDCINNRHYH